MSRTGALKKGRAFFRQEWPRHFVMGQDPFLQGEYYGNGRAQEKGRSRSVTHLQGGNSCLPHILVCERHGLRPLTRPPLSLGRPMRTRETPLPFAPADSSPKLQIPALPPRPPASQMMLMDRREGQARTKFLYLIFTCLLYKLICK